MQTYRLRHRDHTTLFEGDYRTTRECVEDALRQNICLDGASFTHLDLSEVNLDGCHLSDVDFNGANLTGANISEARLTHCNFSGASLFNVCFAQSDLSGSIFTHASFGGTDIAGTNLTECLFSGMPALGLPFTQAQNLHGSIYELALRRCNMSLPPVVIAGLEYPVALFDQDVLIGDTVYSTVDGVWLQDVAMTRSTLSILTSDLHKPLSLLQRFKTTFQDTQKTTGDKSTKS